MTPAQDINMGGYLIPAYAVSALAALWSVLWTYSMKTRLTSLESSFRVQEEAFRSSMHRQEEAFRLVHSPRIAGGVKLWAAFCELERALRTYVSPARVVHEPKNATKEEKQRAYDEQIAKERQAVSEAWLPFKNLHDEAEVLLPAYVFEPFTDLYETMEKAFTRHLRTDFVRGDRVEHIVKTMEEVEALLKRADDKRPAVVAAMRNLISGTDT